MAGSFAKFRVPLLIFRFSMVLGFSSSFSSGMPDTVSPSVTIPISTGNTSTDSAWAITVTVELPSAIFWATIAVTSLPLWVTPSSITPLSAHMATSARLSRETRLSPRIPAILITFVSRSPRLFNGLAI